MFTKTVNALTKAVDVENRTIEQIVSVFDNLDLGGDRVKLGAFVDTLAAWDASPNKLSAYFSHQWDDPFANLGAVIASEELSPGDERIPDEQVDMGDGTTKSLRELGGLLVKYQFDPEGKNPFADQVFWLLSERRIFQASFAYDIVEAVRNSDGTRDLIKLRLLEVGPTLLGMNPATTLLTASRKDIAALAQASDLPESSVLALLGVLAKDISHTFCPDEDGKCTLCGKGQTAVAHINRLSDTTEHGKKSIMFTGSVEERQAAIHELGTQWAQENDIGDGGFYYCYLEATFDDRAIFLVEGWSDRPGQGAYYEASITTNDDGTFSMSEPEEVVVEQSTRPKATLSSAQKAAAAALWRAGAKTENTAKRKNADTIANQDDEETTDDVNSEAGDGNEEGEEPEVESESEEENEDDDDTEAKSNLGRLRGLALTSLQ